jgi:tetratricopeptide (TPR) repeat protein
MRARDVARMALETGPPDADSLARLGLVNAFLVDDYAVEATKDAETALARVAPGLDVGKERSALVATARALLALAAGDLVAAKQQADAATAVAPDPPAFALLASARVRSLTGDAVGAARDLDRAMGLSPELAPVVVDWASSRLEGGDPVAARRALAALLERSQENSRALLSLADAERALGEPTWVKSLEQACKSDAKISRAIRAACAFEMASQARLDGDRAGALRRAKAVSQTSEEPQLLARVSLMLAGLGETDAAEDVLGRARKLAAPANVSLQWADAAIRLNRGEVVETSQVLEHPAGPERDLVALRAAYARQGVEGLAAALKALPPGILDIDWDVRAFSALAREGGPAKPELLTLEKRGEKGSPAISYVLGVLATRGKDFKLAMRRLEKALALHGDTCRAGMLYLDAAKHVGKRAQPNKAALRSIRAHNAKCPLPEL